jgi:hypothetical protein
VTALDDAERPWHAHGAQYWPGGQGVRAPCFSFGVGSRTDSGTGRRPTRERMAPAMCPAADIPFHENATEASLAAGTDGWHFVLLSNRDRHFGFAARKDLESVILP